MTSPTPGPWGVSPDFISQPERGVHITVKEGVFKGFVIADIYQQPDGEANARLIALAPDLLEALQDLVTCAEVYDEFHDPNHDYYVALKTAQAAIEEAERS